VEVRRQRLQSRARALRRASPGRARRARACRCADLPAEPRRQPPDLPAHPPGVQARILHAALPTGRRRAAPRAVRSASRLEPGGWAQHAAPSALAPASLDPRWPGPRRGSATSSSRAATCRTARDRAAATASPSRCVPRTASRPARRKGTARTFSAMGARCSPCRRRPSTGTRGDHSRVHLCQLWALRPRPIVVFFSNSAIGFRLMATTAVSKPDRVHARGWRRVSHFTVPHSTGRACMHLTF